MSQVLSAAQTTVNKKAQVPALQRLMLGWTQTSDRAGKINPLRTVQVTVGAPGGEGASHTLPRT